MGSVISELYHGTLHPNEHDYTGNGDYAILAESFKQDETWLLERLNDEEKKLFSELLQVHDELMHLMCYESFCDGFILGASLVMEVCNGARTVQNER